MANAPSLLKKLGLDKIKGYTFYKQFQSGSSMSCLYTNQTEKVVIKFLICPRNSIEIERFKLEYSVLKSNRALSNNSAFDHEMSFFQGPETSYPLPEIRVELMEIFGDSIFLFGYKYEKGQLLSSVNTSSFSLNDKFRLLHRLASGLSYLNQTGYAHRDLHPENILLMDGFSIPNSEPNQNENDPRVKFLDMGSCQTVDLELTTMIAGVRIADEKAVIDDSGKRLLSSFTSMPPDYLHLGNKTKNYDTWAFGVYSFSLVFGVLPFTLSGIDELEKLNLGLPENVKNKLRELPLGAQLIFQHLLSPKGHERPRSDTIVRLFSWLIYRNSEINNLNFARRVIHNNGFDPDHNPLDDIY